MKRFAMLLSLLLVVCLLTTPSTRAESFVEPEVDAGFLGAGWLSGDIKVAEDTQAINKQSSPLARFFVDYYINPNLAMGFYTQFSMFAQGETSSRILEGGFSFKPRILLNSSIAIKPSLMLGFRRGVFNDPCMSEKGVTGIGTQGGVEFQFAMADWSILFLEGGVLNQLTGKNIEQSVTWMAIPYVGMGIAF
jgi:hypothetical protein